MLFFEGETNSLTKGSSIKVLEDRGEDGGEGNAAGDGAAGEHATSKHVGEDRNKDIGADFDEGSGWRDSGRAADVLRQSSEAGRRW